MENIKQIKIIYGEIIKIIKIDLNIPFEQFLEMIRANLSLNKNDNFSLFYKETELNSLNYKNLINLNKIRLKLILEKGKSLVLKSTKIDLINDLDGTSQTLYKNEQTNLPNNNEFFKTLLERINELEKNITEKFDSKINAMNEKLDTFINQNNISKICYNNAHNSNLKNFKNENCSICQTYISYIKYECIFCPKPKLFCDQCAKKHVEHPLLQFYLERNYNELNNGTLILEHFKNKFSISNSNNNFPINTSNQNNFFALYYTNKIRLSLQNINPTKIAVSVDSQNLIKIQVHNDTNHAINKLRLIITGGRRVTVQNFEDISLKPFEKKNVLCGVAVSNGEENQAEKIIFNVKNEDNIYADPLEITFYIIKDAENIKNRNLDIFLKENNIKNIEEEDKIKLISLMKENEPFYKNEVYDILKKYLNNIDLKNCFVK